jgi:glycine/D-amino acid oxidase-like deaminating enzyme
MSESTDRVLIAGGGIAGLATAAALGLASALLARLGLPRGRTGWESCRP